MLQTLIVPTTLFAAVIYLLCPNFAHAAGDSEAGKVKAYTCTGCHGVPGYNNIYPTYKVPKIGGQNHEYTVAALKAYKNGERDHSTMELQASSLGGSDMEDMAAYFASLELNSSGDATSGLEKSKLCETCHGATGLSVDPNYPHLAGQHKSYIVQALSDYRSGLRSNAIMAPFASNLSNQDIKDLAAWYSKQRGLKDLSIE